MKTLWDRLEKWAKSNAKLSLRLRKGASEKTVAAAEKKMKLRFPADFRESLLAHDGQETNDAEAKAYQDEHGGFCGFEWMPGCSPLATLDAIVERWEEEQDNIDEDDEPKAIEKGLLHNVLWHAKRIPIAGTPYWDGDNTYIDLFPGPKGADGQLITFVTECDMVVLGSSMSQAVESYLQALESKAWVHDAKKGHVRGAKEKADDYPNESDEFASWVAKAGKKPAPKKTAAKKPAPKKKATAKKKK
jgi:cell wall assembly regulator SMI1